VLCGRSHLQLDAANIPVTGGWKLKTKLIFQSMITLKSENQFFMTYSIPHEICPPLLTHPGWHLLTHMHRVAHS